MRVAMIRSASKIQPMGYQTYYAKLYKQVPALEHYKTRALEGEAAHWSSHISSGDGADGYATFDVYIRTKNAMEWS